MALKFTNKYFSLPLGIICLLMAFIPITNAVIIDRIVAVVNGEITTLSELQELEFSLKSQIKKEDQKDTEITSELLDRLIDKKLQLQLADKKNITVSPQQINAALEDIKRQNNLTTQEELIQALAQQGMTIENFTRQLTEHIKITILLKREVGGQVEIDEDEINKYYQEHISFYNFMDELRAKHILIYLPAEASSQEVKEKKELAEDLLQKLKEGADFSEMAKKHSNDPSAERGGDLGFFKRGEMLPALEKAAFTLTPGEISPVIKTKFGFHIIQLIEHRRHTPQNNPNVKEEIKQIIYRNKREESLKKWLNDLRKKAKIKKLL